MKKSWKVAHTPLATNPIWQDPTSYDPFVHGPPYLPQRMAKKAGQDSDMLLATGYDFTNPYNALPSILILLRALSTIHQTNHWVTRGPTFYSDHLLFERLYGEVTAEIDTIAERAIGMGNGDSIADVRAQMRGVSQVVSMVYAEKETNGSVDEGVNFSFSANQLFLICVRRLWEELEKANMLTEGTKDLLAGISSKHEEHSYLLKQRLLGSWKAV
jgi:starvation-inducible DNA-binding protein